VPRADPATGEGAEGPGLWDGGARWLLAFGGYAALTAMMMWPVATHLSSAFPHDAVDPALNTWILWWNAHAVPLSARWWNATAFWPLSGALSFSEHLLGISVLTTPLQWLGAGPLTAYNIALLISYPLTALAAHALAFAVVRRHDAGALAGLIFGFSPYRVAQMPHIQMLWVFGMPLALLALHRYLNTHKAVWLAAFAAAWMIQALANGYLLLFFPVLLCAWILWFVRDSPRSTLTIVLTWVVASLPLVPILWTYERIHSSLNLTRWFDEIRSYSADLTSIFVTAPEMIVWHGLSKARQAEGELFPGTIALALVAAASIGTMFEQTGSPGQRRGSTIHRVILVGLTFVIATIALSPLVIGPWHLSSGRLALTVSSTEKPLTIALALLVVTIVTSPAFTRAWRQQSAFAFYTAAAVSMWVLSLGPRPQMRGTGVSFRGPYAALLLLPGFSSLRVPARFAMLAVLCLAVAAALAFARLTTPVGRRVRQLLAVLCGAAIVAESWSTIAVVAPPVAIQALVEPLPGPVIELPLGITERDAAAQYRVISHRHPVVNGYSGYEPPSYHVLSAALSADDGEVLEELARDAPLTIVVDRREQFDHWTRLAEHQHAAHVMDEGDWRIYRLSAASTSTLAADAGAALPIQAVEANAGADWVGRMIDGDIHTEWNSRRVQGGGEQIVVDLGVDRRVDLVRMMFGEFSSDYPRRLSIECAADGGDWQVCFNGSIAPLVLRSVLIDPRLSTADIRLDRDRVRRLRLTQTAVDSRNGWSIAELAILGR